MEKFNLKQFNQKRELLPEGTYEVYVSEVSDVTTSTNGNKKFSVNYTVRDDVEGQEAVKGRKVMFDNFTLTDKAMFRFHNMAKAIGLDLDKEYDSEDDFLVDFTASILYKPLRITIKHEVRKDFRTKEIKLNEDGQPIVDLKVSSYIITKNHDFVDPKTKQELAEMGLDTDNDIDITEDDLPL